MLNNTVIVDIKIHKIQELRVIQAIAETKFDIAVPKKQAFKLAPLKDFFNMDFKVGEQTGIKLSELMKINHSKPETFIGSLTKPLIFPHGIPEYCKTLWLSKRKYRYTFAGLITKDRSDLIEDWINNNIVCDSSKLPITDSFAHKMRNKLFSMLRLDNTICKKKGDLIIWSSTKGRVFPAKSWDDDYFKVLADSEFVLCPSGVCVWSYRFFESILCGAIPIVELNCEAYEGFRFKYMTDKASDFVWSQEDAEYNFKLCLERITLPIADIENELSNFVSSKN